MNKHISKKFDTDLESARNLLMEMGGLVERQVKQACEALMERNSELAEAVRVFEHKVNRLELELDERCVQIIALQQPAALDLRMMVSIMRASTDLERIGDEADRIAKMAQATYQMPYPPDQYADFSRMAELVLQMVAGALDAFTRMDDNAARSVILRDDAVDSEYRNLLQRLVNDMTNRSEAIPLSLSMLWAVRALERIGDHAKNIGEYTVYLVQGQDVRHPGDQPIAGH